MLPCFRPLGNTNGPTVSFVAPKKTKRILIPPFLLIVTFQILLSLSLVVGRASASTTRRLQPTVGFVSGHYHSSIPYLNYFPAANSLSSDISPLQRLQRSVSTTTSASVSSDRNKRNKIQMASSLNDDEFGDDSFLADLDVDMLVQQHQQQQHQQLSSSTSTGVTAEEASADSPASKRRRVSTSPSVAAAVAAVAGPTISASRKKQLESTLQKTFGYSSFRPGQLSILQTVLSGNDACVFWATGKGKSLCYQIPALLPGCLAIVVSPLISLMQDQCHKINYLSDTPIATYLGSAQTDPAEEQRALTDGAYALVYVTPEKLLSAGFLDRLARLHQHTRPVSLIAIDEAHCVSEWGHDFRPEFRQVGKSLRTHAALQSIPILALTATAVPRVQEDIEASLYLRNPFRSQQSFDRDNLRIRVIKKTTGGMAASMKELLQVLKDPHVRPSQQSTIVYAPTRSEVEQLAALLQASLRDQTITTTAAGRTGAVVNVDAYHGGMSTAARTEAHRRFLTGQTTVMVATLAFGMGIDKTDVRRIIHYGPPKTVEEYYQQIGRAGRDGVSAECILYTSTSDMDRYKSDFYLGSLTGPTRQAVMQSMDALKAYSLSVDTCRRKALLGYFNEAPAFGDWCGTCDVCQGRAKYGADAERNFAPLGAHVVLHVVDSLSFQGLSQVAKVLGGSTVESYRYKDRGIQTPARVQKLVEEYKENLPRKSRTVVYLRELLPLLGQKGYIQESTKTAKVQGFSRSWTAFSLTPKGRRALQDESVPIVLPVPESIREEERKEEEKRQRLLAELEANGIKVSSLPEKEVAEGDGEVIRAYSKWYAYVENSRKANKEERVQRLESLLALIDEWRSQTASQYQTAPGEVLAEHRLASVAYMIATLPPGVKPDAPSLVAVGLRQNSALDQLMESLNQWVAASQPERATVAASSGDHPMVLESKPFQPSQSWKHAIYKPAKKTGKATWEASYLRFQDGESPQTIAMTQEGGKKPIQVMTVVGHVLEGLSHGRAVDMKRLSTYATLPTKSEWEQLVEAEIVTGMDVTGDPEISGPDETRFTMKEFLRPIVGDSMVDSPYQERTDEEKEKFSAWCNRLKWFMALRRSGYLPNFSPAP